MTKRLTRHLGRTIEHFSQTCFLVHTGGMYGYHYFPTIAAAKTFIEGL